MSREHTDYLWTKMAVWDNRWDDHHWHMSYESSSITANTTTTNNSFCGLVRECDHFEMLAQWVTSLCSHCCQILCQLIRGSKPQQPLSQSFLGHGHSLCCSVTNHHNQPPYHHHHFNSLIPYKPCLASFPIGFSCTYSGREPLAISSTDFLWAGCPSCSPSNSAKTLKETQ